MSGDKKIIVPGTDNPSSIAKVLESMCEKERVATIIVRRGERFLLKIKEVRKEVVIGEVRCLNWSPEMGRKIWQCWNKDAAFTDSGRREILLADAIDKFGSDAHRYRVYLPIEDITAVYEDLDDRFDQTPFLPLP